MSQARIASIFLEAASYPSEGIKCRRDASVLELLFLRGGVWKPRSLEKLDDGTRAFLNMSEEEFEKVREAPMLIDRDDEGYLLVEAAEFARVLSDEGFLKYIKINSDATEPLEIVFTTDHIPAQTWRAIFLRKREFPGIF